jgi:hypothetical protein
VRAPAIKGQDMTRSLKILASGLLAVVALGVAIASSAEAAEFHCSAEPCKWKIKPDGTVGSATAHHVIVFKNTFGEALTVTCEQWQGEVSTAKTVTELNFSAPKYLECDVGKNPVTSSTQGCTFRFTPGGTLTIKECVGGVEFKLQSGCVATIKEGTNLKGIAYHNIGSEATTTTEMTVEMKIAGMAASVVGNRAECGIDTTATPITAEYTTGNFLVTGATVAGAMANAWWA